MKTIFKMDYKYNTHILLLVKYVQYTCNKLQHCEATTVQCTHSDLIVFIVVNINRYFLSIP